MTAPLFVGPERLRVEALLHGSGDLSPPFAGEQWILPWLDIYLRPSDQSRVHWQSRDEGGVLFPFMIRRVARHGVPLRELRFLGTGDAESDEVATEYPDITCDGVATEAAALVLADYFQQGRGWDLFRAEAVLPGSVLAEALSRCGGYRMANGLRYCLNIASGFDAWLSSLGASSRSKFRRTLRRVDEMDIRLQLDIPADSGLKLLGQLHEQRWSERGQLGVFASAPFCEFHRRMLAGRRLGAHIAGLYRGDTPLALWYGFDVGGVRYFYQGGFDPDAGEGFSPGEALHLLMIRDAMARGLHRYDFMKGSEDSWKARFGAQSESLYDWILPGRSVRGAIVRYGLQRSCHWQKAGVTS